MGTRLMRRDKWTEGEVWWYESYRWGEKAVDEEEERRSKSRRAGYGMALWSTLVATLELKILHQGISNPNIFCMVTLRP